VGGYGVFAESFPAVCICFVGLSICVIVEAVIYGHESAMIAGCVAIVATAGYAFMVKGGK